GLDPHDLSEADQARLQRVLTFSTQMEQAGDMVESNLLIHADKRVKRGLAFSPQSEADVRALMERLSTNLRLASSLFMTEDPRAARMLAEEKSVFRNAEAEGTKSHLERMRDGQTDSIETSSLHLDLLSDMKQKRHEADQQPHRGGRRLSRAGTERRPAAEPDRVRLGLTEPQYRPVR
ncbi:MAG: hypothetical protein B7Y61_20665, partial [Rhizobiales bacterium 35-66-30]